MLRSSAPVPDKLGLVSLHFDSSSTWPPGHLAIQAVKKINEQTFQAFSRGQTNFEKLNEGRPPELKTTFMEDDLQS